MTKNLITKVSIFHKRGSELQAVVILSASEGSDLYWLGSSQKRLRMTGIIGSSRSKSTRFSTWYCCWWWVGY